jgi:hypothetical protein
VLHLCLHYSEHEGILGAVVTVFLKEFSEYWVSRVFHLEIKKKNDPVI